MTGVPSLGEARTLASELLADVGMGMAEARRSAQSIVLADAWGIPSHGLSRLPHYLRRLTAGGCNPRAVLRERVDTGPLLQFDGEDGLGHWQLWRAAELARDRCAQHGVAVAAVGRSSHCGALGVYTLPALGAGFVALAFTNGPAAMPPWGGSAPVLSTSPIAAGIPCRPRPAIVDLATSAVARGKVAAHARRGEPLEPGWAFSRDGRPTTDPAAALAGMLAPLGGPKGYALAFLVEALTGGLVGPLLSAEVRDMFTEADDAEPQGISHLVLTLDPVRLDVDGSDGTRLDELARRVTEAGGRAPGSGRPLPEELDDAAPLPVAPDTWAEILGCTER